VDKNWNGVNGKTEADMPEWREVFDKDVKSISLGKKLLASTFIDDISKGNVLRMSGQRYSYYEEFQKTPNEIIILTKDKKGNVVLLFNKLIGVFKSGLLIVDTGTEIVLGRKDLVGNKFSQKEFYVQKEGEYAVGLMGDRWQLINSEGEIKDIQTVVPSGYKVIGVNGKYFVLENALGIKQYLDPEIIFGNKIVNNPVTFESKMPKEYSTSQTYRELATMSTFILDTEGKIENVDFDQTVESIDNFLRSMELMIKDGRVEKEDVTVKYLKMVADMLLGPDANLYPHLKTDTAFFVRAVELLGGNVEAEFSEFRTVATSTVSDGQVGNTQKEVDRWKKEVYEKRQEWIDQARKAYLPLLELVPEDYKERVRNIMAEDVRYIYELQEMEINERFSGGKGDYSNLLFDWWTANINRLVPGLKKYLEAGGVSQKWMDERNAADYWENLVDGILIAARELETNSVVDNQLFNCAAYGWLSLWGSEYVDYVKQIGSLIEVMQEVPIKDVNSIISALVGGLAQAHSGQKLDLVVLGKQIEKILGNKKAAEITKNIVLSLKDETEGRVGGFIEGEIEAEEMGKAADYLRFLTNDAALVRIVNPSEKYNPVGEKVKLPEGGISVAQIMKIEADRVNDGSKVISAVDLKTKIEAGEIPSSSSDDVKDIRQKITVQAETDAEKREIAQNAIDATKENKSQDREKGKLRVDFYRQIVNGVEEMVEEAVDNGTGALSEVALLIPKSTKIAAVQQTMSGFFGVGKFTIYKDVDRVEIITKNNDRAMAFYLEPIKDSAGNLVDLKLVDWVEFDGKEIPTGVTIRRINKVENIIPELESMLAQRSWKTFSGMAVTDQFEVDMVTDDSGEYKPLEVKKELLSETDFVADSVNGVKNNNFGKMRVWQTEGMPLQIVDRAGLRINQIPDNYFDLIPDQLKPLVKKLGIVIQIPLPLIEARNAFDHEGDYLKTIQKYIAVEFYKAMANKAINNSQGFTVPGLPRDFVSNIRNYTGEFQYEKIRDLASLAAQINKGDTSNIDFNLLNTIAKDKVADRFVKLLVFLEVSEQTSGEKTSLWAKRQAVLAEMAKRDAEAKRTLERESGAAVDAGIRVSDRMKEIATKASDFGASVVLGKTVLQGHREMENPGKIIVKAETPEEVRLLELAKYVGGMFGIEQTVLVSSEAHFAGMFGLYEGKSTMFINRAVAWTQGKDAFGGAMVDASTDTVIHELAHLLERQQQGWDIARIFKEGLSTESKEDRKVSGFTHQQGVFTEMMQYISAVMLAQDQANRVKVAGGKDVMTLEKIFASEGTYKPFSCTVCSIPEHQVDVKVEAGIEAGNKGDFKTADKLFAEALAISNDHKFDNQVIQSILNLKVWAARFMVYKTEALKDATLEEAVWAKKERVEARKDGTLSKGAIEDLAVQGVHINTIEEDMGQVKGVKKSNIIERLKIKVEKIKWRVRRLRKEVVVVNKDVEPTTPRAHDDNLISPDLIPIISYSDGKPIYDPERGEVVVGNEASERKRNQEAVMILKDFVSRNRKWSSFPLDFYTRWINRMEESMEMSNTYNSIKAHEFSHVVTHQNYGGAGYSVSYAASEAIAGINNKEFEDDRVIIENRKTKAYDEFLAIVSELEACGDNNHCLWFRLGKRVTELVAIQKSSPTGFFGLDVDTSELITLKIGEQHNMAVFLLITSGIGWEINQKGDVVINWPESIVEGMKYNSSEELIHTIIMERATEILNNPKVALEWVKKNDSRQKATKGYLIKLKVLIKVLEEVREKTKNYGFDSDTANRLRLLLPNTDDSGVLN
jgi:hypothetical protein